MTIFVKVYALLVPLLILGDLLWLGVIMKDFYRTNLGHLMGTTIVWPAAVVFYLIFTAGLVFFAVVPGVASGSLIKTVLLGAAFGFFAYATYDLTNHATLRNWPLVVTLVDIAWGTFLSGALAAIGFMLARLFT